MTSTRDRRVESIRPLLSPAILLEEIGAGEDVFATVREGRAAVEAVLEGRDDRLVTVVGPCSIHDTDAAIEYGERLVGLQDELEDALVLVMRVYFEKPRTTVGWKGLINDPDLDGSFRINEGLRRARALLRDLSARGIPCGCEFLDPISPQFIADLVAWGAIGARTTESQVHRQLASGLSMPIGFKNGTRGSVQMAVDAVLSAASPHRFIGVTGEGLAGIVVTRGNPYCHVILRGGSEGPNHDAASVAAAAARLEQAGLSPRLMVDCSHGNSRKDHRRQPQVAAEVGEQIRAGTPVFGVMLESFLVEGRQEIDARPRLRGQSVTDACIGWDTTVDVLRGLADAVRDARSRS